MAMTEEDTQALIDRIQDLANQKVLTVEDRNKIYWICITACEREIFQNHAKEG